MQFNPSIIFGCYTNPITYQQLLRDLKKNKIKVREIKFIDVQVPIKRKDEIINFFKHFIWSGYWKTRRKVLLNSFMGRILLKQIKNKVGYDFMDYEAHWRPDTTNPLLSTLTVPLFIQTQIDHTTTDEEKKQIIELSKFQSKGYKPKLKVKNDKDMRFQDVKKKEII